MPVLNEREDPGRREEGAVFAPMQVRRARSPRILASVAVVALAGLVGVGALDRLAEPDDRGPDVAAISAYPPAPTPAPTPTSTRSSRPPPRASLPASRPIGQPAALMTLEVRPAGSHLFIHGDVFTFDIVRVRIKLEDTAGHVAARTAVDLPGGSTAFLIGAVPRFDAHFFLPDEIQADGFVVAATALDAKGRPLFTIARSVARSPESM